MFITNSDVLQHYSAIIVGGGQAGLSLSFYLQQRSINHLVIEKKSPMHAWRNQRWDAFSLVTPNWQCALPGWPYAGNDPHGFMKKDEILTYLEGFKKYVNAPLLQETAVQRVSARSGAGFLIETAHASFTADQVVVASGGYHQPIIPRMAERIPKSVVQLHSEQYRNPAALPDGAVLVVGCGQSGAQIAEDLHVAGRKVVLATGNAPRCARFYRGKDVVDWLADMGYYDMAVHEHPLREGVRDNTNHYVTGRDGGRDIDLRKFALEGMELFGLLKDFDGEVLHFEGDLAANLDHADQIYRSINLSIDKFIAKMGIDAPAGETYMAPWYPPGERLSLNLKDAGITSVIWCIGFQPDFGWLDVPVFNGRGQPAHARGVTQHPGVYFLGLPWLHTWGSGRFSGVARDALYLAEQIEAGAGKHRKNSPAKEAQMLPS